MINNLVTVFSGSILERAIAMVSMFVLAKILSVSEFGDYNYIIRIVALLSVVVEPFANTYLRDYRFFDYKKYNCSYIFVSVILSFLFYIFVCLFVRVIPLYVFIPFCLNLILLSLFKSYTNVHEQYRLYSSILVLQQFGILLSIFIYFYVLSLNDIFLLISITYTIASIFILIFVIRFVEIQQISFRFSLFDFIKLFEDSFYLVLYWSILPIISFLDMYYVEKFLTGHDLGLYSFSLKLFAISLVALPPMLTVLRIHQIDIFKSNNIIKFIREKLKYVILFSALAYICSIIGSYLLTFYFFPKYSESYGATVVLISTSFISYLVLPFSFLMAMRKYKLVFINSIIALFLTVSINYFFIPIYGIIAAGASTFVAHSFMNISGLLWGIYYITKKTD